MKRYRALVRHCIDAGGYISSYWPTFSDAANWVKDWPEAVAAEITQEDTDSDDESDII